MADSDPSIVIPAAAARRVPWKNGAGWTNEIHVEPATAGDADAGAVAAGDIGWLWRLSVAEIDEDARFSVFPGVERALVLLSGNGLRLRFDHGPLHTLQPPHGRLRFAGEQPVHGELVDGPTRDFNLMWRRERVGVQLWHRPLVGPMVVFVDPGSTWVVYLLAGAARLAPARPPASPHAAATALAMGDTALLRADGARTRHMLEGGGEALLIRIDPL
ncbi:MAG TPA: HutD family protein [Luteimonas sp.]|nr:HutD family protein [Luteimonas sp.]